MLARLGLVLYWTACVLAVLIIGALIPVYISGEDVIGFTIILPIVAGFVWLIGRAIKFVFTGE